MSLPKDEPFGFSQGVEPMQGPAPEYPSPWTTTQPREGLRDNGKARVVSLVPDVCLTPRGNTMVPVPYNIHDIVEHDENFTPTVRFTGQKAMVFRSKTSHVHGNEQGTGGGVKSGTTPGPCEPIGHASQLNAEGSPVIRHLDRFWMNNRNTIGEGRFVKDTKAYKPPEDDDPVPGSVRRKAPLDDKRVLSDASPDPLIPGEHYAQAPQGALAQPAPLPAPANPLPSPGGNVIRPDVPQWRPAPLPPAPTEEVPTSTAGKLMRLGRYGVLALPLLIPGDTPTIPYPSKDADSVEKDLNQQARDALTVFDQ